MSRIENRVFFPQAVLDRSIVAGAVEFQDGELTILPEGRRFRLFEAVHIVKEVGGGGDLHELAGRAKERSVLDALGAELFETSMLLGDAAYDVIPGWVGVPVGSFAEHAASVRGGDASSGTRAAASNDEELLARFSSTIR